MSLNWHILMLLPVLITIAWYCKIGVSPPIFSSFLLRIVLAIPRSFVFPNNMHIYVYLCVYIYMYLYPIFSSFFIKNCFSYSRSFEFPSNMHIYIYVCIYMYLCVYVCIYVYIYKHTQAHIIKYIVVLSILNKLLPVGTNKKKNKIYFTFTYSSVLFLLLRRSEFLTYITSFSLKNLF